MVNPNKVIPILRDVSWRHKSAVLKQEVDDETVKRLQKAISTGFEDDYEMYMVTQIKERGREQIEALSIGGAPTAIIAKVTETPAEIVQLYLDVFFDVTDIESPLVMCDIALREMNPGLKSLKVFAARRGWESYLRMHKPEVNLESLNVRDELKKIYYDCKCKMEEISVTETGTAASKELAIWGRLAKDSLSELLKLEEVHASAADEDVHKLIAQVGTVESTSTTINNLDVIQIKQDADESS